LQPGRVAARFWYFKFAPPKEVHNFGAARLLGRVTRCNKNKMRRNKNESILKAVQQIC
jgi:hypothetical protein